MSVAFHPSSNPTPEQNVGTVGYSVGCANFLLVTDMGQVILCQDNNEPN